MSYALNFSTTWTYINILMNPGINLPIYYFIFYSVLQSNYFAALPPDTKMNLLKKNCLILPKKHFFCPFYMFDSFKRPYLLI